MAAAGYPIEVTVGKLMPNGLKRLLPALCVAILACSGRSESTTANLATTVPSPATAATPLPTQSIPYVLPAWQYVTLQKASRCWGASAGANDSTLWWAEETCSLADSLDPRLPASCSGPCHLYAYVDFGLSGCGGLTGKTFAFNNTQNESGFLHTAPNPIASSYRSTRARSGHCTNYGGTQTNDEYYQNLGSAAMQSYIYSNVWSNTNGRGGVAAGYAGVMEDDVFTAYAPVIYKSSEYGGVWLWQRSTGPNAAGIPWFSAVASFLNSMCPTGGRCIHTSFNGIGGAAVPCATVIGGDCYGSTSYAQGYLNNAVNVGAICSLLNRGNVDGIVVERALYGFGNTDGKWTDTPTIAAQVNTAINMATGVCPGIKWIDFEQPSDGPTLRYYMTGLQWLVPDRSNGIPDVIAQWRYASGPRNSQIASFWPEYTVVPQGPEQPLSPYHYSGSAKHAALGCPSTNGDTGGIVALVVACAGNSPVWAMQYRHCYINRADIGPCATLVNTSPNPVNVTASMFRHDPIATYRWQFAFSGLQMANVQMGNRSVSTGCAVAEYCNGAIVVNGSPFKGDGSDTIPGRSAIFIHG